MADQPNRKYFTELALNMHCVRMALVQQHSLKHPQLLDYFDANHPCHIYAICRRPRISMRPQDVKLLPDSFQGTLLASVEGIQKPIPFAMKRDPGGEDFEYRSLYPYTEFELVTPDNQVFLSGTTALLIQRLDLPPNPLFDLEVLYVGQAYGDDGDRFAPDRLQSHSTLQRVYAEAIRRSPDMDIWLVLFGFDEPYLMMHMDGTKTVEIQSTDEEDHAHIENAMERGITEQQRINYVEAAMIRYFQSGYNKVFKDTFPNPAHKTYAECYDLDLNAVMVELNSEGIYARLFSCSRRASWQHFIAFELHSRDERISMFDFGLGYSGDELFSVSKQTQDGGGETP
jgi:hypothetical protein